MAYVIPHKRTNVDQEFSYKEALSKAIKPDTLDPRPSWYDKVDPMMLIALYPTMMGSALPLPEGGKVNICYKDFIECENVLVLQRALKGQRDNEKDTYFTPNCMNVDDFLDWAKQPELTREQMIFLAASLIDANEEVLPCVPTLNSGNVSVESMSVRYQFLKSHKDEIPETNLWLLGNPGSIDVELGVKEHVWAHPPSDLKMKKRKQSDLEYDVLMKPMFPPLVIRQTKPFSVLDAANLDILKNPLKLGSDTHLSYVDPAFEPLLDFKLSAEERKPQPVMGDLLAAFLCQTEPLLNYDRKMFRPLAIHGQVPSIQVLIRAKYVEHSMRQPNVSGYILVHVFLASFPTELTQIDAKAHVHMRGPNLSPMFSCYMQVPNESSLLFKQGHFNMIPRLLNGQPAFQLLSSCVQSNVEEFDIRYKVGLADEKLHVEMKIQNGCLLFRTPPVVNMAPSEPRPIKPKLHVTDKVTKVQCGTLVKGKLTFTQSEQRISRQQISYNAEIEAKPHGCFKPLYLQWSGKHMRPTQSALLECCLPIGEHRYEHSPLTTEFGVVTKSPYCGVLFDNGTFMQMFAVNMPGENVKPFLLEETTIMVCTCIDDPPQMASNPSEHTVTGKSAWLPLTTSTRTTGFFHHQYIGDPTRFPEIVKNVRPLESGRFECFFMDEPHYEVDMDNCSFKGPMVLAEPEAMIHTQMQQVIHDMQYIPDLKAKYLSFISQAREVMREVVVTSIECENIFGNASDDEVDITLHFLNSQAISCLPNDLINLVNQTSRYLAMSVCCNPDNLKPSPIAASVLEFTMGEKGYTRDQLNGMRGLIVELKTGTAGGVKAFYKKKFYDQEGRALITLGKSGLLCTAGLRQFKAIKLIATISKAMHTCFDSNPITRTQLGHCNQTKYRYSNSQSSYDEIIAPLSKNEAEYCQESTEPDEKSSVAELWDSYTSDKAAGITFEESANMWFNRTKAVTPELLLGLLLKKTGVQATEKATGVDEDEWAEELARKTGGILKLDAVGGQLPGDTNLPKMPSDPIPDELLSELMFEEELTTDPLTNMLLIPMNVKQDSEEGPFAPDKQPVELKARTKIVSTCFSGAKDALRSFITSRAYLRVDIDKIIATCHQILAAISFHTIRECETKPFTIMSGTTLQRNISPMHTFEVYENLLQSENTLAALYLSKYLQDYFDLPLAKPLLYYRHSARDPKFIKVDTWSFYRNHVPGTIFNPQFVWTGGLVCSSLKIHHPVPADHQQREEILDMLMLHALQQTIKPYQKDDFLRWMSFLKSMIITKGSTVASEISKMFISQYFRVIRSADELSKAKWVKGCKVTDNMTQWIILSEKDNVGTETSPLLQVSEYAPPQEVKAFPIGDLIHLQSKPKKSKDSVDYYKYLDALNQMSPIYVSNANEASYTLTSEMWLACALWYAASFKPGTISEKPLARLIYYCVVSRSVPPMRIVLDHQQDAEYLELAQAIHNKEDKRVVGMLQKLCTSSGNQLVEAASTPEDWLVVFSQDGYLSIRLLHGSHNTEICYLLSNSEILITEKDCPTDSTLAICGH